MSSPNAVVRWCDEAGFTPPFFDGTRWGVPVPPDDSGPGEGPLGKIVDGELVHALVPREEWRYPTFREGYDALLADGSADSWVGRG